MKRHVAAPVVGDHGSDAGPADEAPEAGDDGIDRPELVLPDVEEIQTVVR